MYCMQQYIITKKEINSEENLVKIFLDKFNSFVTTKYIIIVHIFDKF